MQSSAEVIPKTQAFAIIGGVTVLVLCACALLASWRLDDWDLFKLVTVLKL